MNRGLLDTSVVIARSDDPAVASALPDESAISVATLAELHFGALVARDDTTRRSRLRRLGEIEAAFQALEIDSSVARAYATLAQAVQAGRQPRARVMDLWIAATALVQEVPVYTRNGDDFLGLERLVEIRVL